MYHRAYVTDSAIFDPQGKILPTSLMLRGEEYIIDRVLDIRRAAALKAGGQGTRYTIRIGSHETFLFQDEENRWFVEEKE